MMSQGCASLTNHSRESQRKPVCNTLRLVTGPGFGTVGACAGMACMWASTHRRDDQALLPSAEHADAHGSAANGTAAAGVIACSHSATTAAAASGQVSVQFTPGGGGVGTASVSSAHGVDSCSTVIAAGLVPSTVADTEAEAVVNGLPREVLVLPAPECLTAELNGIDKDLQNTLRCLAPKHQDIVLHNAELFVPPDIGL